MTIQQFSYITYLGINIGIILLVLVITSLIVFLLLICFYKINKKYLNPEKFKDSVKNYIKIKLSIKEHNYLLGINNKIHWYDLITHTYTYYISETEFIMYKYLTIFTKIFTIFILPIYIIIHGVFSLPELLKEYKEVFLQKYTNSFYKTKLRLYYKGEETEFYSKLKKIHNHEKRK